MCYLPGAGQRLAGAGAAAEVGDEPHPVADVQPVADAVPCLRVVGGVVEHLGAGRAGDAAGGEGDAALVDLIEVGAVGGGAGVVGKRRGRQDGRGGICGFYFAVQNLS